MDSFYEIFPSQTLPVILLIIRGAPLAAFSIIYSIAGDGHYLAIGLLLFFSVWFFLTLLALVPTGSKKPGRLERIARY